MSQKLLVSLLWALLFYNPLFGAFEDCFPLIARLAEAQDPNLTSRLALIEARTAQGSLIDFQEGKSLKSIRKHNQEVFEALRDPIDPTSPKLVASISQEQASLLVNKILNHPTHGRKHEKKYDPEECYGFCFGRATLVHNEALRRGVDPAAIKKIWVVGSLERGRWQFHVATMIKAKGTGTWWVMDPVYSKAISVKEWIRRMQNGADDNRMMVFVTDPRRFSVYDPRVYSNIDLLGDGKSDFYNGYFKDYLEHTAKDPQPQPFSP